MGKIIKKIVLTGGPSAGKSSSLETIKKYYEDKGYVVFTVNESATELITSGLIPNKDNLSLLDFQETILNYQLYKEDLIENIASTKTKGNVIIIYDRGVLDNKAYITDEEFDELLKKYDLSETDILKRYDLVIHLETGAKSKYYRLDNNKARRESIEEAKEMDTKTFNAWKLHDNLVRIKCFDDFEDKKREIIKVCENSLNKNKRKQYKFIADKEKLVINPIWDKDKAYIRQYYLDCNNLYEYRLRRIDYKGKISYKFTIQQKEEDGVSNIIFDKFVDEKTYNLLLDRNKIKTVIEKTRFYINFQDVKLHIDIFDTGNVIIESNDENFDHSEFEIIENVTNKKEYLNANIINTLKKLKTIK